MNWEKIKKLNVQIVVPEKIKRLLFLIFGTWMCTSFFVEMLDYLPLKAYRVMKLLAPICTAIPAIVVFKKEKRKFRSLFGGNIFKQILIGVLVGALMLGILSLERGGIQWSIGTSLFSKYNWYKIYMTIYYLLIVGFVEEFIYRVVIQDYIANLFRKNKFMVPLLTASIFGFAHYWIGGWYQVLATFFMGVLWGYMKFYVKDVTYLTVSISHGVYNYGILVIPFIMSYI